MPPLGKWFRPVAAAGVTAAIVIGGEVAQAYARSDLKALAEKYPSVKAAETVKGIVEGIPIIGGLTNWFLQAPIETFAETGVPDEDKAKLKMDAAILQWVPIVEIGALVVGVPVALYLVWIDVIRGPRPTVIAAHVSQATAPVAATLVPAGAPAFEAAERRSGQVLAESGAPVMGNPTTFERGTQARAVRDVLARHIEDGGGAKEPFAVATARVKEEGPARAAEGLPPAEVKAELAEQTEAAKG